jgi:AAA ATPase domain
MPAVLAGRDREINRFEELLTELVTGGSERSLMAVGFRGMGKTVLLNRFEVLAAQRGCEIEHCEPKEPDSLAAVVARAASQMLISLRPSKKVLAAIKSKLSLLEYFVLEDAASGLRLRMRVDVANQGALSDDLTAIFVEIGQTARERDTPAIFLFDEMQQLGEHELQALLIALHRVTQLQLPVVLVGTGLPHLATLVTRARAYGGRMFDFYPVGLFNRHNCEEAIEGPARTRGVDYTQEAVDALVELTSGYPYYVQTFGLHVWRVAQQNPITRRDVTNATPLAQKELETGFLAGRLGETTTAQRAYLVAMARLGSDQRDLRHVERSSRGRMSSTVRATREQLINGGHIALGDEGRLSFTIPDFDDFVLRRLGSDVTAL